MLRIHVENAGDYTLCRPIGDLDAFTVGDFRAALSELALGEPAPHPQLLIDLSEVTFLDSAGLSALIGSIRRAREVGGEVAVCCNRPALCRLLHTTGFDRIAEVTTTLADAVKSLRKDQRANT